MGFGGGGKNSAPTVPLSSSPAPVATPAPLPDLPTPVAPTPIATPDAPTLTPITPVATPDLSAPPAVSQVAQTVQPAPALAAPVATPAAIPAPVPLPPAAHPPTLASSFSVQSGQQQTQSPSKGMGFASTLFTSPEGVSAPASTSRSTLLGQ